jgi:hypothetical protein
MFSASKSDIPDLNRRISEQMQGFFHTNNKRSRKRRKCEKKERKKDVSNSLLIFFCPQFEEFISLVVILRSVDKQMLSILTHTLFKKSRF